MNEAAAEVFPARAGMNRGRRKGSTTSPGVPRAGGDEPAQTIGVGMRHECSPRGRG